MVVAKSAALWFIEALCWIEAVCVWVRSTRPTRTLTGRTPPFTAAVVSLFLAANDFCQNGFRLIEKVGFIFKPFYFIL